VTRRVRLNYAPSPGQLAFHQDRYVVPERALFTGTGGGKTYTALFEVLDWYLENRHLGPGTILWGEPTVPMFKKIVPPTWERLTGAPLGKRGTLGEDWNRSDRHLVLPGGWEIWFVTVEDPTNIEGPPEVDLVALDEGRVVRRFAGEDGAWSQMTRRLRGPPPLPGRPARRRGAILATHSPTHAITQTFKPLRVQRYKAPGPYGLGHFEVAACYDPGRRTYQWSTYDSVAWGTLARADAARLAADLSPQAVERVIHGRFALPTGLVWDSLRDHHIEAPPPGTRFEWFTGGIDWGWTEEHPCALVLWGHAGSRSWVLGEDGDPFWDLARIKKAMDDLAAAQALRRLDGEHEAPRVKWYGGHDKPEQAAALRAMGVDVETYSGRVEDGVDVINRRTAADEVRVHPDCERLLHDRANYVRGKDGQPDKKQFDPHWFDAARYGLMGGKRPTAARIRRPTSHR
jgi:hypothetical protein